MLKITSMWFYNKCLSLDISKNILVAYSGGLDSSVLLNLTKHSFYKKNYDLKAIHVNHLNNSKSRTWSLFCKQQCTILKIPLYFFYLKKIFITQANLEDAFRIERYKIFSNIKTKKLSILLGHTNNDFTETFLLRLLRGAGILGLSNIKEKIILGKINILRPLLKINKYQLSLYAKIFNIKHIEDLSNFDNKFDRNYLRNKIMPIINKKWLNTANSIYRCSNIFALNNSYIYKLTKNHLHLIENKKKNTIFVEKITQLPKFFRHEILRLWIKKNNYKLPLFCHLMELDKILFSYKYKNSALSLPMFDIKKYGQYLYILKKNLLQHSYNIKLHINIAQQLPNNNSVISYVKLGHGITFYTKEYSILTGYYKKQTKKLFQTYKIPPWARLNYPIIIKQNKLAMIVGLWISPQHYVTDKNHLGLIIKIF